MHLLRPLATAALALTVLTGTTPAHAQRGGRDEQTVERLLDEARQAYDNLELDQADAALEQAVTTGERAGLRGRIMADVHIQRGIIAHVRDKDRDRAIDEFKKALQIDRSARIDSLVSTPSLESLFETARRQAATSEPRDTGMGGGGDDGLTHKPVKRARANQILAIQAKVSPDLRDRMYRIYLYFRTARTDNVTRIQMKDQGDLSFVARIAAKYMRGEKLTYYLLVEDREGNELARFHGPQDPLAVDIEDFATGDSLNGEEGGDGGDDADASTDDDADKPARKRRIVSLGVSVGTGVGRITEKSRAEGAKDNSTISSGFTWSPFHTMAEVDFWVTQRVALGGFSRIQIADPALLFGGRLKFDAVQSGKNHLVVRGGGGYGKIAHQVPLEGRIDFTLEGPYFYTLGLGWQFDLTPTIAIAISPDFYHLIGPQPAQHFDLNAGAVFSF